MQERFYEVHCNNQQVHVKVDALPYDRCYIFCFVRQRTLPKTKQLFKPVQQHLKRRNTTSMIISVFRGGRTEIWLGGQHEKLWSSRLSARSVHVWRPRIGGLKPLAPQVLLPLSALINYLHLFLMDVMDTLVTLSNSSVLCVPRKTITTKGSKYLLLSQNEWIMGIKLYQWMLFQGRSLLLQNS